MSDRDDPTDGIRTGRGPGDPDGLVTVDDVVAADSHMSAPADDAAGHVDPEGR